MAKTSAFVLTRLPDVIDKRSGTKANNLRSEVVKCIIALRDDYDKQILLADPSVSDGKSVESLKQIITELRANAEKTEKAHKIECAKYREIINKLTEKVSSSLSLQSTVPSEKGMAPLKKEVQAPTMTLKKETTNTVEPVVAILAEDKTVEEEYADVDVDEEGGIFNTE
jgi:cysteinyl-tRNA synthetase